MIAAALLLLAGVIHLLPLSGVLGAAALERLYAVQITHPDLVILMQHRAVLFGLLGGLMIYAAFVPGARGIAVVLGLASTISFLVIALLARDGYGPALRTVVWADVVAILALSGAAALSQGLEP